MQTEYLPHSSLRQYAILSNGTAAAHNPDSGQDSRTQQQNKMHLNITIQAVCKSTLIFQF